MNGEFARVDLGIAKEKSQQHMPPYRCLTSGIQTLQLIELQRCRLSVIDLAKPIQEEQQSWGNDDLIVRVHNKALFLDIFGANYNWFMHCRQNDELKESTIRIVQQHNSNGYRVLGDSVLKFLKYGPIFIHLEGQLDS
ncbi:hypothetical protein FXO37_04162 [Capsicum annuum]|nr:hypothetical protein FXO37_04162 [Capsicum annuum]